ncbi:6-phosphogluconate dehydrogenase-like protein [Hapsidospora chrysogenum ATCC 11550]|uniref:6-phosphogluconate dehydrogenase, decarboxylating n=1 Tax=Hapsidospora chrysogenum (strain ATCC 11550 / CBS 779.69 / DSM 880 / IAM 14645 / JCM 23072 / IMI 49137) TaxID=857340 RepID=A0A086SW81_HAPC1|nr:6-phosphogluconate dehydrogenase-like protein [Hapsidospora chrysogenum ATCC 11550]
MDIRKLGMIGVGNMGGMLSLLFAEHGIEVHFFDPSDQHVDDLQEHARTAGLEGRINHHRDYQTLCESLDTPKVLVFSTPHGSVADKTISSLDPWLKPGDIIMDAGNEHWQNTVRRQESLAPTGIHYIGMGVSGGYQSARSGPSLSPGGSKEALDVVFPFLQRVAARDAKGRPCTVKLGPGGSGHFVKMVHNGIEHGMMTGLCEVWGLMAQHLSMSYEDIGNVFEEWNKNGPLQRNYLVDNGSRVCRAKDPRDGSHILANVRDKVVQDVDNSEGTGTWTLEEATRLHVPAPVIAAAHMLRITSADAAKREAVPSLAKGVVNPERIQVDSVAKFTKKLETATYACFLTAFIEGLHIISRADRENGWGIDFAEMLQLWRGGCIIQSDFIVDVLEGVYQSEGCDRDNLMSHPTLARELKGCFPALKHVVLRALEADGCVPVLAAALQSLVCAGSEDLPTSFQEAQMDAFGAHMYDLKTERPGRPETGGHHFEWMPARGPDEDD